VAALLFGALQAHNERVPIHTARIIGVALAAATLACEPTLAQERLGPVALKDLVPAGDPLAFHDLQFDARFAQGAVEYLRSGNSKVLGRLSDSAAAAHLLSHARNFDYDVPKDSAAALVGNLLAPTSEHVGRVDACAKAIDFFYGQMLRNPQWVNDALRYLPADFRYHGSLFLIFGYDIGVAFGAAASLNCGHPHFEAHPSELTYYAVHELHHVGFMAYQPPPRLSDLRTCADVLRLVKYSTQLEGMAVWAVYARRRDEGALDNDPDYVALADEAAMERDEASYFADFHYLERRSAEPANEAAWAVVERMSGGRRLWYRVGARMAARIEGALGRAELVNLVRSGPSSFLDVYLRLKPERAGIRGSGPRGGRNETLRANDRR